MRVLTIISGILMVATAAFCFINPGQTFMTMAFVVGSVMVVCGIIHTLAYLLGRNKKGKKDNNGWILIDALLTLLLGILILCNQLTVDMAIPMIFGMWVLVSGLLRVEAATRIDREKKPGNFKAAFITGIITVIIGLLGFINPFVTYVSVVMLLGIFMLVSGINSIELGVNMPHDVRDEIFGEDDMVVYKKKSAPVKIDDETDESPEAVEERFQAQKEEKREKEFVEAIAIGDVGLSPEEVEIAAKELEEKA